MEVCHNIECNFYNTSYKNHCGEYAGDLESGCDGPIYKYIGVGVNHIDDDLFIIID